MNRRLSLVAAATLLAAASFANAQMAPTLKVGDKAPALTVGKWVKGEPVTEFKPGTVYVIECWATWCGPCIAAIPHVTELQHKYKDKVVVIGQNVWEEDESKVQPFVEKMGDKMDYKVVMDSEAGQNGAMAKSWLAAAGRNGIPCSFIVDAKGNIAWIGHPMAMDKPLEKIVAGNFDPAKYAEEEKAQMQKSQAMNQKLRALVGAGDVDGAYAAIDEAVKSDVVPAQRASMIKFSIAMATKKMEKFYEISDSVLEAVKDEPQALNQVAWAIATEEGLDKRDLKVAKKFAERGVEVTKRKDPALLDTLARVQFDSGEVDKAIATQTEAIALNPEEKAQYEEALTKYKAAKK